MSATKRLKVSKDQAGFFEALARGRTDIEFWFTEILGVNPNKAQRRWFRLIRPQENGWEWRLRFVIHVAANQTGKTLGVAGLILWACNYKIGVPTDDHQAWLDHAYTWFHLAPTQQQAYIPLKDIRELLAGSHVAQRRPCRIPEGFVSQVKIEQYYDGLSFWNGATVQFRTIEDKAKALLGRRAAGISVDEAAFEDHLKVVVNEVLWMRLIASSGPLWLISTPNGINDFYEFVQGVIDRGLQVEDRLWEAEDAGLVWSVITDNEGYGLTTEDIARMERDLDESTKEQQLRGAFLEPSEAFFVPATEIIKAWSKKLPDQQMPIPGHQYVIFWDPSVSSDPTEVRVIDVTSEPWVGVYQKHYQKPPAVTQLIHDIAALHALYNSAVSPGGWKRSRAITGFDATSMGGAMLKQQLAGIRPQRPLNLAGPSTKLATLTDLRAALTKRRLLLPSTWLLDQRQVLNYRLDDKKLTQDAVMALSGAVYIAARGFSGTQRKAFSPGGRITQVAGVH